MTHDWLGPMTGAERVLQEILNCFPGADVYTAIDFLAPEHRHILGSSRVHTSFIQRLPNARARYWNYIPLMPFAFEMFGLGEYDLVLSNSHTVAKGVRTHRGQANVCYLETPMRFAWDLKDYYLRHFRLSPVKRRLAATVFGAMRAWDAWSAKRVDEFVSVSGFVAKRCASFYGRASEIVYPPVDVDFFTPSTATRQEFFLTASRLTPFKRLDLIVEAFSDMPDRRLVVIGDGPDRDRIESLRRPNVTCLGYQPNEVLRDHMRRARAFLFPAPEDFGLIMAEAQACGTPVIALGVGGASEIVRDLDADSPTGVLFSQGTVQDVRDAVRRFERSESRISAESCRANAMRFAPWLFRERLTHAVQRVLDRKATKTWSPGA